MPRKTSRPYKPRLRGDARKNAQLRNDGIAKRYLSGENPVDLGKEFGLEVHYIYTLAAAYRKRLNGGSAKVNTTSGEAFAATQALDRAVLEWSLEGGPAAPKMIEDATSFRAKLTALFGGEEESSDAK